MTVKIPKIKANVNAGVQFKDGAVKSAHTKVSISDHWDVYGEKNDKETKVGINYKTSFK